jgi:serine/threonine protein kinase
MEQKLNEFKRKRFELMNIEHFISSELFIELLECVSYLHKQNPSIISNLKPSNVLITIGINGRLVKLGDFGLATIHFDDETHTEGLGSFRYVSPEVMRGRTYDTKADIYSLGVITEELFAIDIYS